MTITKTKMYKMMMVRTGTTASIMIMMKRDFLFLLLMSHSMVSLLKV